jgi:hypothetical protein
VSNQRRNVLCFLLTIICMGGVVAHGQVGRIEQGLSVPGEISITNGNDTTSVSFYLRNGDGDWTRFSLEPNQDSGYKNATSIRIVSKNKTVQYKVVADRRYRIFWKEAERHWDLERL